LRDPGQADRSYEFKKERKKERKKEKTKKEEPVEAAS